MAEAAPRHYQNHRAGSRPQYTVSNGPGGVIHGWTLDLMRRREGGFGPVMEFLIGSSARDFAAEGALTLSLSGAPLAHEASPDEGAIAQLLTSLSSALEPVYGFRSLHRFKTKFNPRYEPIYLLYRDNVLSIKKV